MQNYKLFLFFIFISICSRSYSQHEFIPGDLIVQFIPDINPNNILQINRNSTSKNLLSLKLVQEDLNIYHIQYDIAFHGDQDMLEWIRSFPEVIHAQFNHMVFQRGIFPDDPYFDEQWAFEKIGVIDAWEYGTGGRSKNGKELVIAVLDSGFDINHEDFQENIWSNQLEIPFDGLDNDNNGYIDDYWGWNPRTESDIHATGNNSVNHGTAVAGLIGAKGDNDRGIAGINWDIKMMFISGLPTEIEIIAGYDYVLKSRRLYNNTNGAEGAFIIASNMSLGIPNAKAEDFPIWCGMYDLLGEEGIVNVGATDNANIDVEENGDMPTSCESSFLISVTNTDREDVKAQSAAYGKKSIDIGAPGVEVISTKINNNYSNFSGTSASSPIVAGAIALLYSAPCDLLANKTCQFPMETALHVREFILAGAKPNESLSEITAEGARLDVHQSFILLNDYCQNTDETIFEIAVNPLKHDDDLIVNYQSKQSGVSANLSLYNSIGQLINTIKLESALFGRSQNNLGVIQGLSSGTYFLELLEENDNKTVRKLLVY